MSHVRVVFDAFALHAYLELDGVAAGELIGTVAESGGVTGLPALVIADVWPNLSTEESGRLRELLDEPDSPVEVLPLLAADVVTVLQLADRVKSDAGLAHAVHEACRHNAVLATTLPAPATALLDSYHIIDLS
jgi:hypothetical protein